MKKALSLLLALAMALSLAACSKPAETTKSGDNKPTTAPTAAPGAPTTAPTAPPATIASQVMTTEAAKEYREEIIVGIGPNGTFDPLEKMANAPDTIGKLVWNQLVQLDLETMTVMPELAVSWETVSVTEYKFKLRDDITFSNGDKFTSADVAWSFQGRRAAEEAAGNSKLTANDAVYKKIDEIVCDDDYNVTFKLKSGDADFINRIVTSPYSIFSKKACEADMEKGWWIGTGGWVLDEVVLKDHWTFHRNDTSWVWEETGITPTKKLTVQCFSEESAEISAIQAGKVAACTIAPETGEAVKSDKNLEIQNFAAETAFYMAFNMKSSQVGGYTEEQKNLRKAIAYGIDREALNDAHFLGLAEITNTLWGKSQYGRVDDSVFGDNVLSYDLDKAQDYFKKSGADASKLKLKILSVAAFEDMATLVQAMLEANFGIEASIQTYDSTTMNGICNDSRTDKTKDEFDLLVYNISLQSIGDRFNFTSNMSSTTNRAAYTDERQAELYKKGLQTSASPERLEIYKEIQLIMNDNMAYMPWCYGVASTVQHTGVGGIIWSLDTKPDYTHIFWEK